MATASQSTNSKKMEYKKVKYDVNEILPDAPAGQWECVIPRGKCKVQPTKEDKFPMVVVPVRLEKTDEEGEEFQRALGTDLTSWLVFGGNTPRAERMSKFRIRQFCEALDIDLDLIPKEINDPENDFLQFIRAIEGKRFTAWTFVRNRTDTGEDVTELRFQDPSGPMRGKSDDDDDGDADPDDDEDKKSTGKGKAKPAAKKKTSRK